MGAAALCGLQQIFFFAGPFRVFRGRSIDYGRYFDGVIMSKVLSEIQKLQESGQGSETGGEGQDPNLLFSKDKSKKGQPGFQLTISAVIVIVVVLIGLSQYVTSPPQPADDQQQTVKVASPGGEAPHKKSGLSEADRKIKEPVEERAEIVKESPVAIAGPEVALERVDPVVQMEPEQEIIQFLHQWQSAWEQSAGRDGKMEPYLNFYADTFMSRGLDKQQWRQIKTYRNKRKTWIKVAISGIKVKELTDQQTFKVKIRQEYRSSNYSINSNKTLVVHKGELGWQIVASE